MNHLVESVLVADGKYVVRYLGDREVGQCVAADFEISVGSDVGKFIHMLICSKKATQATRMRSGLWLEWMAYEGDSKAAKVLDASLNSVAEYMLADVKDGYVIPTSSPTTSEATFNKFLKQLCELWSLSSVAGAEEQNLLACRKYRSILDLLPRLWGTTPGERELRLWLNDATDPSSPSYFHAASVWLNSVYVELGGSYERPKARSWPLILKNNGFDKPPKPPKEDAS